MIILFLQFYSSFDRFPRHSVPRLVTLPSSPHSSSLTRPHPWNPRPRPATPSCSPSRPGSRPSDLLASAFSSNSTVPHQVTLAPHPPPAMHSRALLLACNGPACADLLVTWSSQALTLTLDARTPHIPLHSLVRACAHSQMQMPVCALDLA